MLVLLEAVRAGIPAMVNTFGQLGASSPVTMAGSIAQTMAETLAGMVIVWLCDPSARAVGGARPMVTDLRTVGLGGGSGEQALATAMAAEMCAFYGLPNSVIAGATDIKGADTQAGYEKVLGITLAVHAGAHMITQACGMHAGLMGVSLESYVLDNEMLGSILRTAAPVEVDAQTLALDTIETVVNEEGHFLGQDETYKRMKSDFLYAEIADSKTVEDWEMDGQPNIVDRARKRVHKVLASHYPRHLSDAMENSLRARFDIRPGKIQVKP